MNLLKLIDKKEGKRFKRRCQEVGILIWERRKSKGGAPI
jgi:hypothetical protein